MISERQKRMLKINVEDYIKTAKPVSSSHICNELDCSSATIRNEMSYLEEIGYLEKTHTSSGRVPSEKGYRYYVDNLITLENVSHSGYYSNQLVLDNISNYLNKVNSLEQ